MAVVEVSQHNPASPPSVSVYAVKCWQAQPWHQLQHDQLLSEQRAGLASLLCLLWAQRTRPEWPAQSPHSQQGRGGGHRETNFLTLTWSIRTNPQHFIKLLIYIQHPGNVSEYFEWLGGNQDLQISGRSIWSSDTWSLPSLEEILSQSVQTLCSPQLLPSRKVYWARSTGISLMSLAVNLALLLEMIIFSWCQSTGMGLDCVFSLGMFK